MTLNLCTPCFSRLLLHHPSCASHNANTSFPPLFFSASLLLPLTPDTSKSLNARASVSKSHNEISHDTDQLDQRLRLRVAAVARDADEALQMIAQKSSRNNNVISTDDCCAAISAA